MFWKTIIPVLLLGLLSCTNEKAPDISGISVELKLNEFHTDFFSIDTSNMENELEKLKAKYPEFLPLFLDHVLGLDSNYYNEGSKLYIRQNYPLFKETVEVFNNFNGIKNNFEKAFRYVRYYFPDYSIPQVFTIVGPLNAFARTLSGELSLDFMGPGFLALSLQFYLGKDFPVYKEEGFMFNVAPEYRSRRFEKEYLVADGMKLIADDLFPERLGGLGLIEQMVEKGKQWWLLDKFLPFLPDSVKTGFTKAQEEFCNEYEGLIWNTVITNEKDLYTKDPAIIQTYLGEAPNTPVLPSSSPGNIGQWIGWQIVKKFAGANSDLSISDVMKKPPDKLFSETKYKPK